MTNRLKEKPDVILDFYSIPLKDQNQQSVWQSSEHFDFLDVALSSLVPAENIQL